VPRRELDSNKGKIEFNSGRNQEYVPF